MSLVFSDKLMEIFSKHISNKIITCIDRDAPWITPKLKPAIKRNTRVYRKCVKRERVENDHAKVHEVQNITNKLIQLSNYRPISLLPICGKISEKIVSDQVYSYLNTQNLLSKSRGFYCISTYFNYIYL